MFIVPVIFIRTCCFVCIVQSCNLGRHIPVTFKDVCDQGVIPIAMQSDFPDSPHPTFATGIQKYFLDSLGMFRPQGSVSMDLCV